jgi:hypothetical protein
MGTHIAQLVLQKVSGQRLVPVQHVPEAFEFSGTHDVQLEPLLHTPLQESPEQQIPPAELDPSGIHAGVGIGVGGGFKNVAVAVLLPPKSGQMTVHTRLDTELHPLHERKSAPAYEAFATIFAGSLIVAPGTHPLIVQLSPLKVPPSSAHVSEI